MGARAASEHMVDAHVVAAAIESGGGVIFSADAGDLTRPATPHRNVQVVDIG